MKQIKTDGKNFYLIIGMNKQVGSTTHVGSVSHPFINN